LASYFLVGAWFSSDKPNFQTFFPHISKEFNLFQDEGLVVDFPLNNEIDELLDFEQRIVFGVLITCTADNPAKDAVLNKASHDSRQGCANFLFYFL